MTTKWPDILTAIGTVVAAIGTLAIPIVLHLIASQAEYTTRQLAVQTRTLELMNDLNRTVAVIVSAKLDLDEQNGKVEDERFKYEYVSKNPKVEGYVFRLLNEYDYVCLGANDGLFSSRIIKRLRGDALQYTWRQYGEYIKTYRGSKPERKDAWIECDTWIEKNR